MPKIEIDETNPKKDDNIKVNEEDKSTGDLTPEQLAAKEKEKADLEAKKAEEAKKEESKPYKQFATKDEYTAEIKSAAKNLTEKNSVLEKSLKEKEDEISKLKAELEIANKKTKVVFLDEKGKLQKQKDYSGGAA